MDVSQIFTGAVAIGTLLTGVWAFAQLLWSASGFRRWERWVQVRDSLSEADVLARAVAESRVKESLVSFALASRVRWGRLLSLLIALFALSVDWIVTVAIFGTNLVNAITEPPLPWSVIVMSVIVCGYLLFNAFHTQMHREGLLRELGWLGLS